MEGEINLQAYSTEQLSTTEKILPERIAEIAHDVEAGERRRLDVLLDGASEVATSVASKTEERFAFLGSIAMYTLLNELREKNPQVGDLMLLEQRIAGGKNDFDVCVERGKKQKVMDEFGWDREQQSLTRGHIDSGRQMVDFMERLEKPEFPWREVKLKGETILVQNPEEMIFSKIDALVNPGLDDEGKQRTREIKWGVDIKILKAYLLVDKGMNPEELDTYLAEKYKIYAEGERYGSVMQLAEGFGTTETVQDLVKPVLEKTLGRPSQDIRGDLITFAGAGSEAIVDTLLQVTDKSGFVDAMKTFIDHKMGKLPTYEEAQATATARYSELLEQKR